MHIIKRKVLRHLIVRVQLIKLLLVWDEIIWTLVCIRRWPLVLKLVLIVVCILRLLNDLSYISLRWLIGVLVLVLLWVYVLVYWNLILLNSKPYYINLNIGRHLCILLLLGHKLLLTAIHTISYRVNAILHINLLIILTNKMLRLPLNNKTLIIITCINNIIWLNAILTIRGFWILITVVLLLFLCYVWLLLIFICFWWLQCCLIVLFIVHYLTISNCNYLIL